MSEKRGAQAVAEPVPVCGVGTEGLKCAIISWVMPLVALTVLLVGLYVPVVRIFNIVIVAFGITALVRSIGHIRRFGSCGLGGHVALGAVLNAAIVTMVSVYLFTGLDPLYLRH